MTHLNKLDKSKSLTEKLTLDVNEGTLHADDDAYEKPDELKRELLFGLGAAFTFLTGCSPTQEGEISEKKKTTVFQPLQNSTQDDGTNNTINAGDVSAQTHMPGCTAPPTPPGAVPAPPTAGCSTTAPVITPVQISPSVTQTFVSLGPDNIAVRTSDMMMASPQTMANGLPVSVWGFVDSTGAAFNGQANRLCPGPVLELIEGQPSVVNLSSMHPHTLHLHGLDVDTFNDGVPSTSFYVSAAPAVGPGAGPGGGAGAGGGPIPAPSGTRIGSSFNYSFIAPHAGTYMYHCHVDTVLHMEMGMSGTIIVRPADGNRAVSWSGGELFDKEYIWQLHTFDSRWHVNASVSGINTLRYTPDYFMINGLDGDNILNDESSAISGTPGQRILIRLVNLGYIPASIDLGGLSFTVESSDGRPLRSPMLNQTQLLIGPGERYDVFFTIPAVSIPRASVHYLDITGRKILGQAISSISVL